MPVAIPCVKSYLLNDRFTLHERRIQYGVELCRKGFNDKRRRGTQDRSLTRVNAYFDCLTDRFWPNSAGGLDVYSTAGDDPKQSVTFSEIKDGNS